MSNMLQRFGTGAAAILALNAGQVGAQEVRLPTKKLSEPVVTQKPTTNVAQGAGDVSTLPNKLTDAEVVNKVISEGRETSSQQAQPTTSSDVTQKPTGLTPNRDDVDVFLDSQRQLRDRLIQGADKSRRLLDQVPGG